MRIGLVVAAFALAAFTTGASAGKLTGMGANIFGSYFNFNKTNLEKPAVSKVSVGGFNIELQHTRLVDLQKRFGGALQVSGEGSGAATWLCYHTEDANTWFISNALGGQEFVMMIAIEAAAKAPADCDSPTGRFALPEFGIPGLGAATADLKARFGMASGSKIAYRSDRPGGYADIAQYIGYVIKGGKVAGIGVGETSIPTRH